MKQKGEWTNQELVVMLFQHDSMALACLYRVHANNLLQYFTIKFKGLNKDEISDLITDSFIKLVDHPEKFQAGKSSLKTFLIRDISRDILNSIAKKDRAKKRLTIVELSNEHGNIELEEGIGEADILQAKIQNFFKDVFESERDIQLAWMMEVHKKRDTSLYANLLQITHLSFEEQKNAVKQHKDRIQKRLNRGGWKSFLLKLQKHV